MARFGVLPAPKHAAKSPDIWIFLFADQPDGRVVECKMSLKEELRMGCILLVDDHPQAKRRAVDRAAVREFVEGSRAVEGSAWGREAVYDFYPASPDGPAF